MTIVVGHDGSDSGDDAAVLGAQLAHATGEPLVVVAVYPEENPIGVGRVDAEWVAYMREQAEEVSARARGASSRGAACRPSTASSARSSAAHGLDDVAEAEQRLDDRRRLLAPRRAAADLPRLDRRAAAARRDLPGRGRAARAARAGRRTRR